MLSTLEVDVRDGYYCFLTGVDHLHALAEATVREEEGWTLVLPTATARECGYEPELELSWLTLRVHSSLEAVGLTAAVSRVLAEVDVPCNVLAGFMHDHLLVPRDKVDTAIEAIESLSETT